MLAAMLAVLAPAGAQTTHWEPGDGAAPDTHHYAICDTIRQVCDTSREFLVPALHDNAAYWVVRAGMTILAGCPPDTEYTPRFVTESQSITGEPLHDMELLADSLPPGIPWTSDTYTVRSVTTIPDHATIQGHAAGAGELNLMMQAFGARYAFWQDGVMLEAEYGVAGGVLSARVQHYTGDISIRAIPATRAPATA